MATKTLVDSVIHWRKKLDKNLDEDTILNIIRKLSKIPITVEILEVTHIGKTIRQLSKRDDIIGEKAKAVLKKWREIFSQQTVKGNSELSSVSKENVNKSVSLSPGRESNTYKNSNHQKERPNHEYKHEKLSSHSSNQENASPLYTYIKKEMQPKYTDYDPQTDINEGYNPECPQLFPNYGEKSKKRKLDIVDGQESKHSSKHKLKDGKQNENAKRIKTENPNNSNLNKDCSDLKSKKSQDEKEKHNQYKNKDSQLLSKNMKKESIVKTENNSDKSIKHLSHTHSDLKTKSKNFLGDKRTSKSETKVKINCSEEFTSSDVRFEDCLGFNDIVPPMRKKEKKTKHTFMNPKNATSTLVTKDKATSKDNKISKKSTSNASSGHVGEKKSKDSSSKRKMHVNIPKPNTPVSFHPAEVDPIISTLPEIHPNYQPLPQRGRSLDFYSPKKKEVLTNEDAIRFTSSRREKTAVYSGRKTFFAEVPSLFECCTRVLIDNIDAIEYLGDLPYFILKPVLEKCTPFQLFNIENYNPNLLDSTNELWEAHCKRDYKLLKPAENETWRDLYLRAHDERERKLKSLTANISASIAKSNPVRQVKLAFVDSIAKPPRDVARRQAKNGTAQTSQPVKTVVKVGASSKIISKPASAPVSVSTPSSSGNASLPPKKPKVAPLMAKTLKSMKQCFRR